MAPFEPLEKEAARRKRLTTVPNPRESAADELLFLATNPRREA
jgi:hypothetical protein